MTCRAEKESLAQVADIGAAEAPGARGGRSARWHSVLRIARGRGRSGRKSRIVTATGDRTIRSILLDIVRGNVWPAPYSGRVLQNAFSEKWRGREADLLQHQQEEAARYAAARAAGDFDTAAVIAGEALDLITDVPPAAEIVQRMARSATRLLAGASNKYRITESQ
jgi:nitronate monooxygenase